MTDHHDHNPHPAEAAILESRGITTDSNQRERERERFFTDIIVTAVEGGIGYWSVTEHYQYVEGGNPWEGGELRMVVNTDRSGRTDTFAIVRESESETDDGELGPEMILDADALAGAFEDIAGGEVEHLHPTIAARLLTAYEHLDAGMIDAWDADTLAQIALLGQVVYG